MKNLGRLIVLFLIFNVGQAQELEYFNGKRINSEFSKFNKKKKLSQKSNLTFDFQKANFTISIKNTMNVYSSENETFIVDTSNPIPENEDEKEILAYALTFINQPVKYDCSKPKINLKIDTLIALHSLLNYIPALHSCLPLSGLIFEGNYDVIRIDTVAFKYKNGIFINEWTPKTKNDITSEISLKGFFVPDKGSIPNESVIIEENNPLVDSYLKSQIYNGKCIVNRKNGLIEILELKIEESIIYDYHIVGLPFGEIKKNYTISLKNTFK